MGTLTSFYLLEEMLSIFLTSIILDIDFVLFVYGLYYVTKSFMVNCLSLEDVGKENSYLPLIGHDPVQLL